jgi:MscS family membrane protein
MESLAQKLFYQNTALNWVISIIIVIVSLIIGKILFWTVKKITKNVTSKTKTQTDDILIDMIDEPLIFIVVSSGVYLALLRLSLPELLKTIANKGYFAFGTLMVTWFIARTLKKLIDVYLTPLALKTESDFDDQLLPVLKRSVNMGVWALGIVVALNNAGFDVGALIAGMGIGGLALAMAAKDTVSNFFGGVTIFVDQPFRINDRIIISGIDGNVVEIGLRSTRIKTLEGRIVTIPNSRFADGVIENITKEPSRKVKVNLGLTYDTSKLEMEKAMESLKEIIRENNSTEEKVDAVFTNWGDFSLGILLIYYIKTGEDIFNVQSRINLTILEKFNENNWNFAFPTQTIEISKEN